MIRTSVKSFISKEYKMKKIFLTAALMIAVLVSWAQQDAMFTHYSFNTLAVNPGYAGSRDALTVTLLNRSQWVSFPGAPTTQTLTMHAPVANEKVGVGFSILNDKIGPTSQISFFGDFAYKIKVGKGKLAFGLKGGFNMVTLDINSLTTTQPNDPAFQENVQSKMLPNVGAGAYYSTAKYYVGLSTPRLLENNFSTDATSVASSEQRHYFFIGGAIFNLNPSGSIKLKPTTFIKVTSGAPVEMDLTALFYLNDAFWAGPMFRTGDAVGLLGGMNIMENLSFGYSYDWSFANRTGEYNGGSHELMLRYDFFFNHQKKIKSPRYF